METSITDEMNISKCIENLAPVTDGENQDIYIELLKKGIRDQKVKNIALSGSYGSGKSSIIQKFLSVLSSKEKEKYLEISLANFDNNIKPEDEEQHIEKSILQQIFYKVSKNELPYSKLERTEKKSPKSILGNTIAFFVWLISFYVFVKASEIKKTLVDLFALQDINLQTLIILFSFIPLLVSTFYIIYLIVKGTGKIKLNKLSFQGVNLDIEDTKGSLLNRHIDEILYFFETTPYENLIIEDLDRQDGTKIFQKLREINTLLNNYTNINQKKKISFVYAVKDSIFTGEERTKFFELIIPIVPIINTSNAKDILIQKFKDMGILDKLGEDFLKDISYYIHNYRQLTNIVNEFCIYQEALKSTKDYKKLFTLIVYKNFFPEDFSDLQNRKGMIHDIFHTKKEEIRASVIETLNNNLIKIDERLENIEKEHLSDERELRIVLASKLFEEVSDLKLLSNHNSPITIIELVENEKLFNEYVVQGGNLSYYNTYNYNQYNSKITRNFKGDKFGEYERRLKILKDRVLEEKNKLSIEKEDLERRIIEIKYEKLYKLLERNKNKNLLDIEKSRIVDGNSKEQNKINEENKRNWKLIKKLLINGNIDEEYNRYISYFHEGELTRNDYDFITKVKDGDILDFAYSIDDIEVVINELSVNDFKNNIENFAIAEYLFENIKIDEKRHYFINNFFENSSDIFVKELLEKSLQNKKTISSILKDASSKTKLNKLFKILKDNSISAVLVVLINNLKDINLLAKDKEEFNNLLSNFLFNIYNEIEDKEVIKEYLLNERIIFNELTDLNYKQSVELFKFIYQNSLHELTYENIKSILINLFDFKESEEIKLKTVNLTTIRESEAEELIGDIDENINFYFEDCWITIEENIKEAEETLLYLLNHDNLKNEYKKEIIEKSENKITDISSISDNTLWTVLFEENKIEVAWNNVFEYYVHIQSLDESIFKFLNNNESSEQLSSIRIGEKYFEKNKELKEKDATVLLREILENNNFDNDVYQNLIKSYNYWYNDLNIEELDEDKIKILINTSRLMPETKVYDAVSERSTECAVLFIAHYKKEYFEEKFSVTFDSEVFVSLLDSLKFTDEEKFKIIENIEISIFHDNQVLKEKVSKLYIEHNRKIEDFGLFEKLFFNKDNQANEWALELYISQVDNWTCDECQTYIVEFDEPYNELLDKNASKLYMEDTKLNRLLLDKLKDKECISSYDEHKKALGKNDLKIERKRYKK